MQKPVKSVIASARVLLRRPSEVKLPSEDMRLVLHQILEELHSVSIKKNADFYTHDLEIEFTYNTTSKGYTFSLPAVSACSPSTSSILPVFLRYQPVTSDPDEDPWRKVTISKLSTWGHDKPRGEVSACMLGNSWQGLNSPQFKFNATEEFVVTESRWRVACRVFPNDVLGMDDTVPFPGEFTSLIEHMLASRMLNLVRDDSVSYKTFAAGQKSELMMREQRGLMALDDWLAQDVENRVITNESYHYRHNNKQAGSIRRFRTEWS